MRPDLARRRTAPGCQAPILWYCRRGPVGPSDFAMAETLELLVQRHLPVFGVCLGLQGIVEYFGGSLDVLDLPMHGKPSPVRVLGGRLLRACRRNSPSADIIRSTPGAALCRPLSRSPRKPRTGYHGDRACRLPIAAVQFHPESVMTLAARGGAADHRRRAGVLRGWPASIMACGSGLRPERRGADRPVESEHTVERLAPDFDREARAQRLREFGRRDPLRPAGSVRAKGLPSQLFGGGLGRLALRQLGDIDAALDRRR